MWATPHDQNASWTCDWIAKIELDRGNFARNSDFCYIFVTIWLQKDAENRIYSKFCLARREFSVLSGELVGPGLAGGGPEPKFSKNGHNWTAKMTKIADL